MGASFLSSRPRSFFKYFLPRLSREVRTARKYSWSGDCSYVRGKSHVPVYSKIAKCLLFNITQSWCHVFYTTHGASWLVSGCDVFSLRARRSFRGGFDAAFTDGFDLPKLDFAQRRGVFRGNNQCAIIKRYPWLRTPAVPGSALSPIPIRVAVR